jgi:hypothetical protein
MSDLSPDHEMLLPEGDSKFTSASGITAFHFRWNIFLEIIAI